MQDLQEAYFSVYDDINEESYVEIDERLAHKFPLTPKEQELAGSIGRAAEDMARQQSGRSTTKSGRRKPDSTPTNTSVSSRPKSRGTTNKKGDTWTASQHENFYDVVLDYLLDEGYCDTEEKAITMMASMSEEWIDSIISEAPFQISGPHPTTIDGTKLEYSPSNVGKPYKNKKRAQTRANRLNQDHGANVYRVTKVD